MLDAKKLLEYTKVYNSKIFESAKNVKILKMRARSITDEDGDECREVTTTCRGDTIPRTVTMRLYGPRLVTAKMWVSCNCEYFLYTAEVANARKGSSDVIYSNGARPKIRNPTMNPLLCKHCVAAIRAGALTIQPSLQKEKEPKEKDGGDTKKSSIIRNPAPSKNKGEKADPEKKSPFSILRSPIKKS